MADDSRRRVDDALFGLLDVDPKRRFDVHEALEHPYVGGVRQRRLEVDATFSADLVDSHMLKKVHVNLNMGQKHLFQEVGKVRNDRDTAIASRSEKAGALLRRCVAQRRGRGLDHDDITYALQYNTAAGSLADASLIAEASSARAFTIRSTRPVLRNRPTSTRSAMGSTAL